MFHLCHLVWELTSDITHRSLLHCRSEPLNGTSLSADFKRLRFETSNAAWILHLWAQFWRKTSTPFSTFLHWRKLQGWCTSKLHVPRIAASEFVSSFLALITLVWFDLGTDKTFDMLLTFTASTTTTTGINFLSLWIENFRNCCSNFWTSHS